MLMRSSDTKKKLDSFDKDMLKMFGINPANIAKSKPRYGPGVLFDLNIGKDTSFTQEILPEFESSRKMSIATLRNLAYHYRYMDWALPDMNELLRLHGGKVKPNTIRLFNATYKDSIEMFERQRIEPLRDWLWGQGFFFHCVPEVVPAEEDGNAFMVSGKKTLCILPRRVEMLQQGQYHEADILRLAPPVLWVVKLRCSFKMICSPTLLLEEVGEWGNYFPSHAMLNWWEEVRQINPGLVSAQEDQIA